MHKFKVGDKIIGNHQANEKYSITSEGWIGIVHGYYVDPWTRGSVLQVKEINEYDTCIYDLDDDCFDLVESKMKFKVGDYVQNTYDDSGGNRYLGNRGYITLVDESDDYPYKTSFSGGCAFSDEELSLVDNDDIVQFKQAYYYGINTELIDHTNQIEEDLRKL